MMAALFWGRGRRERQVTRSVQSLFCAPLSSTPPRQNRARRGPRLRARLRQRGAESFFSVPRAEPNPRKPKPDFLGDPVTPWANLCRACRRWSAQRARFSRFPLAFRTRRGPGSKEYLTQGSEHLQYGRHPVARQRARVVFSSRVPGPQTARFSPAGVEAEGRNLVLAW